MDQDEIAGPAGEMNVFLSSRSASRPPSALALVLVRSWWVRGTKQTGSRTPLANTEMPSLA